METVTATVLALFLAPFSTHLSTSHALFSFYFDCYTFPEEYTELIDSLLVSPNGLVHNKLDISKNMYIPAIGKHYYYLNARDKKFLTRMFITLEKKQVEGTTKTYYMCFVRWLRDNVFMSFASKLFTEAKNTVRVISIDNSRTDKMGLCFLTKKAFPPKNNQKNAITSIATDYMKHRNTKVLISGVRGLGKSVIGRMVKKYLENPNYGFLSVDLYDDVNPIMIGLNINTLILSRASRNRPTIIIIDEIDKVYEHANTPLNTYGDSRTQHAQNKGTLNKMFDNIGDIPNIIAIYTTEVSIEKLQNTENFKSFMRHGRIDMFIHMTKNESNIQMNRVFIDRSEYDINFFLEEHEEEEQEEYGLIIENTWEADITEMLLEEDTLEKKSFVKISDLDNKKIM